MRQMGFMMSWQNYRLNILQQLQFMKLKINKLLPYSEQNKKYKSPTVSINSKTYYLSPYPLDKSNNVGIVMPLQFICTMPDQNYDYQYLKCNIKIENNDFKQAVGRAQNYFKDIKRGDGKRDFLFEFTPPYRGSYSIHLEMLYKQKYFIQTTQPPVETRQTSVIQFNAEDPYEIQENIVYEQKGTSISFPLFVQYVVTNKHKDIFLELAMDFQSQNFNYRFLNVDDGQLQSQKAIKLGGNQTYYAIVQISQKPEVNLFSLIHGENGLMIGSFYVFQGKNRFQKKLFLKQGYKHLLFKAETIDKKVVKKDIVDVKVKFVNIYRNDYKIGSVRISINQTELPPGIKLLKISRDVIDLSKNQEEIITLTMICLRSGFFQFKGIVLNIKDKNNPKEERILKYINDLALTVQNQKENKINPIMQRTSSIMVDNLI